MTQLKQFSEKHFVPILVAMGVLLTVWFQLDYVRKQVSPESVLRFTVENAIKDAKQDIRYCLTKAVVSPGVTPAGLMACAD